MSGHRILTGRVFTQATVSSYNVVGRCPLMGEGQEICHTVTLCIRWSCDQCRGQPYVWRDDTAILTYGAPE